MPDEYLPPNKILFVQNLPDDTTKESLEALFSPCVQLLASRIPAVLTSSLPPFPPSPRPFPPDHDPKPATRFSYPNLNEVRTIPGRKNIAFVEFIDEVSSGVARDALHNSRIGTGDAALKLKVTFAKQG